MTGDEQCNPEKLAALLDKKQKPKPVAIRPTIRLEAENFDSLENYSPISVGRQASQNVSVRMSATLKGIVRTEFHEPYSAASGRYDVTVRYRDEKGGAATFALRINGTRQGESWRSSTNDDAWTTHTIKAVSLARGDMIEVEVTADGSARGELDFVQLNYLGLDDPAAMPGQIIVDPANRQWLKYNGQGHPCFLFGAGNPEEFFFLGTRQADGTRAGGMQDKILGKLAGAGANTFHLIALRDSRYNLEPGNGAPDSNPFENADISGRLDQDILNQWEGWLKRFEADGTIVLFTFYNDFDDYEDKAGWKLDANGNLHPQERYFVETLVNRFKHHKNIIWVINESCNKLSRAKQVRLKKVAALVAATDNFHHPIMQIFQVLYYDEVHPDKVSPEDYVNDPNVKVMGWGHYSSFPAKPEKGLPTAAQYYKELVGHVKEAAGRYVLFDMEVDKHPSTGAQSRLYAWTAAMAGVYGAINSHRPDKTAAPRETFEDDGRLRAFMETTDFFRMSPNSDLKYGSTLYVLANAPNSYVAYSHSATQNMGIRNLAAGTYLLRWFDTTDGDTIERMVTISPGDHAWPKPAEMGTEVALYVKRIEGVVLSESK
ncbi:hypothetical protein FJY63_04995, partial [Candidatus Sumerlaeota bacterium]|nr:hypothetical protein [Candidatus Sumerlaeota bacterium]